MIFIKTYGDTREEATKKFRQYYKKIVKNFDSLDIENQKMDNVVKMEDGIYKMSGSIRLHPEASKKKNKMFNRIIQELEGKETEIKIPPTCCAPPSDGYIDILNY